MSIIRAFYIYVSKDVSIRGNFSKPKGVREQKSWGNTDVAYLTLHNTDMDSSV
jgi:hypothetical protein